MTSPPDGTARRARGVREARRAHLLHGALRGLARRERHEGVAAVGARHGVHHEAQVPDGTAALEQRDEFVLVHVLGDLAAEHLAAGARRAAFPPGRRPAVLPLTWTTPITKVKTPIKLRARRS